MREVNCYLPSKPLSSLDIHRLYTSSFNNSCAGLWSNKRVLERDLFRPSLQKLHTIWPESNDIRDDANRLYRIAELPHACVASSAPPDHDQSAVSEWYLEQGLVYDERFVYDSDGWYTARLHTASNNATTTWHTLGTAIQSVGEQFYHFIVETLPKAIALLALRHSLQLPSMRILLPGPASDWLLDVAQQLTTRMRDGGLLPGGGGALPEPEFVYGAPGAHHCAQRLFVAPPATRGFPSASALSLVRRLYLPLLPSMSEDHPLSKRRRKKVVLVLARTNTARANWSNLDECVTALRKALPSSEAVIEVFDGQKSPGLANLAAAHSRASLIIGPHGAGFTGILWAQPNTTAVIEVAPTHPVWFYNIARTLRLRYKRLPIGGGGHRSPSITLDAEALARAAVEMWSTT